MKTKLFAVSLTAFLSAVLFAVYAVVKDSKKAAMVREAKITMAQARQIALAKVPGNVEEAKLEREKNKLLFEFEIHDAQMAENEISVDAVSGDVLEVKKEKGNGSAKESQLFNQAKISMDDAESAALAKFSGAVFAARLESERGKTLYEFEIITSDGKQATIHVDAVNGQIEQIKQN